MADRPPYVVLGLNESSTEADMKTAYRSMALRFHPDKKYWVRHFKNDENNKRG